MKKIVQIFVLCQFIYLIHLNAQPGAWVKLGTGSNALNSYKDVNSMVKDNAGNIYVSISRTSTTKSYVSKWNGTTWTRLGPPDYFQFNDVLSITFDSYSGNLYAVGGFYDSNGCYVAKWDGTSWSIVGDLRGNPMNSIDSDNLGNIYVAGWLKSGGNYYVAKWDGASWSTLGDLNLPYDGRGITQVVSEKNTSNVFITAPYNNKFYTYKWDGTTWTVLNDANFIESLPGNIPLLMLDRLYPICFGTFSGDISFSPAIRLGVTWSKLGSQTDIRGPLAIDNLYNYYAANYNGVMKWDNYTWNQVGTTSNDLRQLTAILIDNSGNVYATGQKTKNGNFVYVAKWDPNATPFPEVSTSPINYCKNSTSVALTATGTDLKWYDSETGGNLLPSAPIPNTSIVGSSTYYVSQTINSVESQRRAIIVIVNDDIPPTVNSPIEYCQSATPTALTASGTNLKWYTSTFDNIGSSFAPTVSTSVLGSITYYVSQKINGCESLRASISINIKAKPDAPIVSSPLEYCKASIAPALSAIGTNLKWYSNSSGGIGSAVNPIPVTSETGSISYYVSQTDNGCESDRSSITVNVNALPVVTISPASTILICGSGGNVLLTSSSGNSYKWINDNIEVGVDQTYIVTSPGNYRVIVTDILSCVDTSLIKVISVSSINCYDCAGIMNGNATLDDCNTCSGGTTGLVACSTTAIQSHILSQEDIILYPQPFVNTTKLELNNGDNILSILIFNSVGKLISESTNLNQKKVLIGENLNPGLYSIIIESKSGTFTTKFLKME